MNSSGVVDDSILKEKLMKFFNKKRITIVADVLDKKKSYSLRVVEWFINSYAKNRNIKYKVKNKTFDVYNSYKNEQMKSYSKKHFDLFRRTDKLVLNVDERKITTTIAQLNFFRWAIQNEILTYVENHIKLIRDDLNLNINKRDNKNTKMTQKVVVHKNKVIITFD